MALIGWLWMIVFWGAVIALVVWVVRRISQSASTTPGSPASPMEIARVRYARGEITREEFEDLKRALSA
jgi:putative membrane protein